MFSNDLQQRALICGGSDRLDGHLMLLEEKNLQYFTR
jgi:hypothetical protein